MLKKLRCGFGRAVGALVISVLWCGHDPAFSEPADLDPVIEALKKIAGPTRAPMARTPGSAKDIVPSIIFPTTLNPEPALILRLQTLFVPFFEQQVNLAVLMHKIVNESAVAELPGLGHILYNPAHMLFLHLQENWRDGGDIRVATMEDVGQILKKERPTNPLLAAYGQGFEEFVLLSELMKDADARETLEVIWSASPRSDADKERMRYLLLRPIEQVVAVRSEMPGCRQAIDRFVDDVRTGKRAAIPFLNGLTNIVKPTRFIRHENQILLVLSETLTARYYVIAQFNVNADTCSIVWESPIFAM